MLGAQILAIIALFISLAGWWLAWICGLVATIILLVACCVTFPKNVWLAVAILSAIAAVGEFLVTIRVVDNNIYCRGGSGGCHIGKDGLLVVSIIALIMWIIISAITFRLFRSGSPAGSTS